MRGRGKETRSEEQAGADQFGLRGHMCCCLCAPSRPTLTPRLCAQGTDLQRWHQQGPAPSWAPGFCRVPGAAEETRGRRTEVSCSSSAPSLLLSHYGSGCISFPWPQLHQVAPVLGHQPSRGPGKCSLPQPLQDWDSSPLLPGPGAPPPLMAPVSCPHLADRPPITLPSVTLSCCWSAPCKDHTP